MKIKQLLLTSEVRSDQYTPDDYFISESNAQIYNQLINDSWTSNCTMIIGAHKSGKTHLGRIWGKKNNAYFLDNLVPEQCILNKVVIDDIERFVSREDLEGLLHSYNNALEGKNNLLLITNDRDLSFCKGLPDLYSRLVASTHLKIKNPDDELLKVMIHKQFYLRQIDVSPRVVASILNKSERSMESIVKFIDILDKKCLSAKKPISLRIINEALCEI